MLLALIALRVLSDAADKDSPYKDSANAKTSTGNSARNGPASTDAVARTRRPQPGLYRVIYVIDGDTLICEGLRQRIRLQGIDAPETFAQKKPPERWGADATRFTREFVRRAQGQLDLEFDGETFDHYGRLLAFASHGEDQLNQALVRAGLARALLDFPYSREKKQRLRQAQDEARREARGIWSP